MARMSSRATRKRSAGEASDSMACKSVGPRSRVSVSTLRAVRDSIIFGNASSG